MKEKIKNLSNKKIVITTLCAFAVVLLLGLTYAIWNRTFSQTGENTSTYDCFDISFSENTEGITMENGYPISDEEGLKTDAYEVTITNTCNTPATYNVVLNKLNASTLDDSHIKVAVNNDIKLLSETETINTTIENASEAKIISKGVLAGQDSKKIQVRSWMDEATTKEEGSNKTFAYKITIEAVAGSKTIAQKILDDNKVQNNISFYKESFNSYSSNSPILCTSNNNTATIGTGYSFNNKTGSYSLKNPITVSSYEGYEGYYVVNDNGLSVLKIDDVKKFNDCTVVMGDAYSHVEVGGDGIYKVADNNGNAYIFRGTADNYLSFANKLWRIVSINGDSSIRLILADHIGTGVYNENSDDAKYTGYTYDNDHICTNANPCTKDSGTNSTIKTALETWYEDNLKDYDDKIELGSYCNDTTYTISDNKYSYGSNNRIIAGNPSLICPDTKETYGGVYKLKIGLLTADEAFMGGLVHLNISGNMTNYLNLEAPWMTMSPSTFTNSITTNFAGEFRGIHQYSVRYGINRMRPVINLKNNVKIHGGDGTKDNPYTIE